MRPGYPVNKTESAVDLMAIQEQLQVILGVDHYPHDGVIDVSGAYDVTSAELDTMIGSMITNRLVDPTVAPDGSNYASVYGAVTGLEVARRLHGE